MDQSTLAEPGFASQSSAHGIYSSVRFKMSHLHWPLQVTLPLTCSSSAWSLTSQPFWILVTECILDALLMSSNLWSLVFSSLSELYTPGLFPGLLVFDVCPVNPYPVAAIGPSLAMPWQNGDHWSCKEMLNGHVVPWPSAQPVVIWQQEAFNLSSQALFSWLSKHLLRTYCLLGIL